MQHYQGQNYKVNRKVKEEVDKNQINYRESSNDPISIIKRVYIYITDKKGHIIRNATVTIDEETFITSYSGLLISNFPNEEKTITVEKEGYKTATATIIINAETQTHEFFLVLETDDDEPEVISTDNTQPKEEFKKCGTLFELSDNNTLVVWAPSKFTNEIVDGVYTGKGSYIEQGWSNKRLWQLDYDIKYNNNSSSYINYYVGVMPFCSAEINPYTDAKRKNYCMESWEKWAAIEGMGAACLEGPKNYKYSKQDEYHHATVKKVAKNKIEYYFDNNKWVYLVPNLPNLETLHFGYRDNPYDRSGGSTTISSKNIKVIGLCTNSEMITLNDTVSLGDLYQFISYNDSEGNEEWGPGIVEIESIPEDDELYIEVKVIENEANDSFIGQIFYVKKDTQVGNNIYPLYSDELGTETGIYVKIGEKIEPETPEENDSPCLTLEFNGDSFSTETANPFNYTDDIIIDWGDKTTETYTGGALTHNYSESNNYIIKINGNITELEDSCFEGCTGLTSINIPSSVTSLGDNCFYYCTGLTSINIPSSVTSLGDECFFDCENLTSINIPSSVISLGNGCFLGCIRLTSINIPSNVTILEDSCFANCTNLTSIDIPSSVTSLGGGCFHNCTSLALIDIPSSVTSLGRNCFYDCTSLTSIDIPSSVTNLGNGCFDGCTSLTSVNLNWTTSTAIITYNNSWFTGSNSQFIIPTNTTDLYIDKSYPSDKITTIE